MNMMYIKRIITDESIEYYLYISGPVMYICFMTAVSILSPVQLIAITQMVLTLW